MIIYVMMQNKTFLYDLIKSKSKELNIDFIGICSVDDYVKLNYRHNKDFKSPHDILNGAKSIISAAYSYNFDWNNENRDASGFIARYTTCGFYKILRDKLNQLGIYIKDNFFKEIPKNKLFKVSVNSVFDDKKAAIACNIGSLVKNNLISVENMGTQFILGELILTENIENTETKINKQASVCDNCSKCIDSCPTGALKDKSIVKSACIQHLSTELKWPEKLNNSDFLKLWGKRFYGCTDCIDVCPQNKFIKQETDFNYKGYSGKTFNIKNIIIFKKGEYKNFFTDNQISSSWIEETALVRNALASLFNLNESLLIQKYAANIDLYGWNAEEKEYLLDFCKFLLKQ